MSQDGRNRQIPVEIDDIDLDLEDRRRGEIVAETPVTEDLDWTAEQQEGCVWREDTSGTVEPKPGAANEEREV